MNEKKKQPKLRFPGFTDDWEQRKFKDVGSISMCKRIFKEQTSSEGEIPFFKIGTFGGEPDAFISRELFEEYKEKYPYPKEGDILVSASGTIGRTVVYIGNDEYFQDSNIVWLNHNNSILNSFLNVLYEIVEWNGIEGTTIKRLYNENFLSTEFKLPSVDEQEKIGEYFKNLDNLITLHQRELDSVKKLKQSMLQKMFPRKGETVPEFRFPGFTGAWEQRKLEEVSQCLDSERIPLNATEREKIPGNIPYYGAGNIQGYINKHLFDEELVLLLEDGDAFDDFKTKEIAQYICGKTWVNNHAHVLRPLGDAYFLYTSLAHKDIRNWVQLAGASRKKLVQSSMLNIDIYMPMIEEQYKISKLFRDIDNLITLHQRELESLKKLKKAFLQQMFM